MSSGRSGAPSGRSGPEPSLDSWDLPTGATPRVATGAKEKRPAGRSPYAASERGKFWDSATSSPGQRRRTSAPPGEQVSGEAAARLFGTTSSSVSETAKRASLPPLQAPETTATKARVTARVATAPAPDGATERSRAQTLTQQMRSMQPPDVARQAINELSVLAGELITLAHEMEHSGLARIHAAEYLEITRRYGELARHAWLSVAAERLEQDGATSEYRQLVVGIARDITHLRRESEVAASNEQFPLPQRRPYLWRGRIRRLERGLDIWHDSLVTPADPQRMGHGLFELRGAINAVNTAPLEYTLLRLLTLAALWFTPLSGLAAGLISIAAGLAKQPVIAASFTLVTLLACMLWTTLLLLTSRGRITLLETLAGSCFSETGSACNGRVGSRVVEGLLRFWWLLIGGSGVILTLGALVGSGFAFVQFHLLDALANGVPQSLVEELRLAAGLLGVAVGPAALVATAAIAALAAPTLLVSALRFAGEMSGSRRWVASARRYTLAPALATVAYLTGALVVGAWLLADHGHLAQAPLVTIWFTASAPTLVISERAPLLALAMALPYLALIELPFRLGLGLWRRAWLRDLRSRRTTIEAHVRRLSAPDQRTGAPDTSDETLRAMQYDLVLLQFYSARITEAERASASPFTLWGTVALVILTLGGALLFDVGAHALAQALAINLIP